MTSAVTCTPRTLALRTSSTVPAVLTCATCKCAPVSSAYAHGQLERVVQWIESNRPDVELLDYQIELL